MRAGINFSRIWFDDDVVQLKIEASDGKSDFCNQVYVGHRGLDDLIAGLSTFRNHVHGGLFDIVLGSFGPEYAGGAFHARLHFQSPGKIVVTADRAPQLNRSVRYSQSYPFAIPRWNNYLSANMFREVIS
jgi:hypothetical protein